MADQTAVAPTSGPATSNVASASEEEDSASPASGRPTTQLPGSTLAVAPPPQLQLDSQAANQRTTQAGAPQLPAPEAEQPMGRAPAWLKEARTEGRCITDTACHSDAVGADCDIVLLHLPPGTDAQALHNTRIDLPDKVGEAAHIAGSEVEITSGSASECEGVYVFGAKRGAVSAMRVAAGYQLRKCLSDVEPEEEPLDDAVLDRLLEAEQNAHVAATAQHVSAPGKKKAKRKRKHKDAAAGVIEGLVEGAEAHMEEGTGADASHERKHKDKKKHKHKHKQHKEKA